MNTIDNMGGIISAEYIPLKNLSSFTPISGSVHIDLKTGTTWIKIPISYMGCDNQEDIEETETGTLITNNITIQIPYNKISPSEIYHLRNILSISGIILRIQTTDRHHHIIGTPDYPLFGKIKNLTPKNPAEFRGYQIIINAKSDVQMLLLIEK